MKRILCIWLPDWPVMRLTAARPELNTKPVVLYKTHRRARWVVACSAQAKALGIAAQMPLSEAAALAGQSSPALHLEPYDPAADGEALQRLAQWCQRFSPLVGIGDSPIPDTLLLDITGTARFFGGETPLAARVVGELARRGLAVRVGIADTLGAAWAVAHSPSLLPPSAFLIVPPGETWAALRPLPVEALRLADDVVQWLHQLGVHKIDQLESLPRADLTSRFGPRLLERLDQAAGRLAEPIPVHPLPPQFVAERSLEYPTACRETIELVLEPLIGRVIGMLVERGRGVLRMACRLDCSPAGSVEFLVGLFQPSDSAGHLLELARMQLQRLSLPGPVQTVRVEATVTAFSRRRQHKLFADGPSEEPRRQLAGLVDRLSNRLGRKAVLRARLVSDAQPELACCYDSLAGGVPNQRSRFNHSPRAQAAELPPRPLRLVKRPIPVAVVSLMPDGPPLRFHLKAREHRIARTWGPERIKTGWWRGHPVGRDYYRIEITTGSRYWLFRRLRDGRWFVHGTFE